MRNLTRLAALTVVIATVACATSGAPPQDFTGVWDLTLESGDTVPSRGAQRDRVALIVALLPADSAARRLTIVQGYEPTHLGLFSGESGSLAPGLRVRDLPSVAVGTWGDDSVSLVLNPDLDHGALRLEGVRKHSTVLGRWYHTADGGRHGNFVMRRRD